MNDSNPYESNVPHPGISDDLQHQHLPRKIEIRPIQLLQRSSTFLGGQYGTFFLLTLVANLIGGAVPFVWGALLVGFYLCCIEQERGQPVQFSTLFEGFEFFIDSLLVMLAAVAWTAVISFVTLIGCVAIGLLGSLIVPDLWGTLVDGPNLDENPIIGIGFGGAIFSLLMFGIIFLNVLAMMPFLFTYQLIADRRMSAGQAMKFGFQGVVCNWVGVMKFVAVMGVLYILASVMCFFPLFLLMPLQLGALFLLYRDLYGPTDPASTSPETASPRQPAAPPSFG